MNMQEISRIYYENGKRKVNYALSDDSFYTLYKGLYKNGLIFVSDTCAHAYYSKLWYTNGQLKKDCTYIDSSKLHGLYKEWYENSQLKVECTYNKGVLHNLFKEWHKNGQISEKSNFINGNLDGLSKEWYTNGQLKKECTYVDCRCYHGLCNEKLNGSCKLWYENGQISEECTYVNCKLHGLYKKWYENGQLKTECTYDKRKLHSSYKKCYKNGQIKKEEYYYHGTRYSPTLLLILQRKVKDKILIRKFKTLIQTEGFQQAWMDPNSFGGYWHKQRLLKDFLSNFRLL